MSLGKQLIEQLRQLAAEGADAVPLLAYGSEYNGLVVSDAGMPARLEFFDYDRYSVTLRALEVGIGAPLEGDVRAYLSVRAAAIARRLSYLEEPLAVWELDGNEQTAQLRSSPPQHEGQAVFYWEVALGLGNARITRYRWAEGMTDREVVAYPATFALIGRMADSLAAALETTDG
jgi:hypothetical protein